MSKKGLGHFVATKDAYGADRDWVLLQPIPINVDNPDAEENFGEENLGGPSQPSSSSQDMDVPPPLWRAEPPPPLLCSPQG